MSRYYYCCTNIRLLIITALMLTMTIIANSVVTLLPIQSARTAPTSAVDTTPDAPIATSGNNVYITWWSNKTGNDEVMFKASTDNGKTFGSKMNLSNTPNSDSRDVQVAAAGNNVYVTWWERNQTMSEPVMMVSNDNGKTFGEKIMLSEK